MGRKREVFATLASFRNRLMILFSLILIAMVVYFYLALKASSILKEEKKRKALEIILQESEKRFRIMFELSPAGMILIDEKGSIIEVNSTFCDNLGYSREELLSKNIRLFANPGSEDEIEKNIEKILSGKTLKHEVTNYKKDGSTCSLALFETMIMLPDGNPGILSVSNDITEKKLSQEKMLTLSLALESVGECVSITDNSNKIIFVNNAFCKTYGYSQGELIGNDIAMLRSFKNKSEAILNVLSETIHGGWNGELINVRKDGSEFPIELSTSPIKDENGNIIALIGIAIDITERKKVLQELVLAKEKAEESDRLKSTFLTNMSHELRTPLNAIIGFSSFMAETGNDEETVAYSKIIFESGQHLLKLVEDILDSSMIEIGQQKINYERADIISILNDVKNIITGERLRENKTNIDIILKTGDTVQKFIMTDSRKLKQVLINLLKNALKYTDKGYIEFGFTEIEKTGLMFLQFYVKDSGIGIEKKYHEVIFNIFRQIDDAYSRKYGGAGIGLSIVKSNVQMLGGEIWVESEPGKGSVFYFTVPSLSEVRQIENILSITDEVLDKNFSGKTVLIAEDEVSNFEFLRIFLTRMNISVQWAKTGPEVINLCETDPSIDLVLMDIKMPLVNGYEATRRIKVNRPELPVIAQTAYATLADKEEAFKSGCSEYLAKPLQIKQLNELLVKYL